MIIQILFEVFRYLLDKYPRKGIEWKSILKHLHHIVCTQQNSRLYCSVKVTRDITNCWQCYPFLAHQRRVLLQRLHLSCSTKTITIIYYLTFQLQQFVYARLRQSIRFHFQGSTKYITAIKRFLQMSLPFIELWVAVKTECYYF